MSNPVEKFQNALIDATNKAAANEVHPALVFTILHGIAGDVLMSIKSTNRQQRPPDTGATTPPPTPETPSNVEPIQPPHAAN